jgi:DNA-binding response OmpR family regulator
MSQLMNKGNDGSSLILVMEDVEETRDGIEKLLQADGYRVDPARNEDDAIRRATRECPDLILISPGGPGIDVSAAARRIRKRAELSDSVPVVIFCIETLAEGAEVKIGRNIYMTRPDNFDQLRDFLRCLLDTPPTTD